MSSRSVWSSAICRNLMIRRHVVVVVAHQTGLRKINDSATRLGEADVQHCNENETSLRKQLDVIHTRQLICTYGSGES
jgi:hypothetical protein